VDFICSRVFPFAPFFVLFPLPPLLYALHFRAPLPPCPEMTPAHSPPPMRPAKIPAPIFSSCLQLRFLGPPHPSEGGGARWSTKFARRSPFDLQAVFPSLPRVFPFRISTPLNPPFTLAGFPSPSSRPFFLPTRPRWFPFLRVLGSRSLGLLGFSQRTVCGTDHASSPFFV